MNKLWCLLVLVILALVYQAEAEFYFQRVLPKPEEVEDLGLECPPGRTFIKVSQKVEQPKVKGSDSEFEYRRGRRAHMNTGLKNEFCKICVCSVDGKDEYCSERPAMNVNECIRMAKLTEDLQTNLAFDHTRTLSHRIRRDYIWHKDEVPYEAKARCKRGHSYYTNSATANETDIDVASDVESLLDYSNKSICFYCVCSPMGDDVGCISRLPWFCEYYRNLREYDAIRDQYTALFEQDRPMYFRQLSWRLRRSMDDGMYNFIDTVGGDVRDPKLTCVPYVSEYTDCTDENRCSGCNKCVCVGNNKWSCEAIKDCPEDDPEGPVDYNSLSSAFANIQNDLGLKESAESQPKMYAPMPSDGNDLVLGFADGMDFVDQIRNDRIKVLLRSKRSVDGQVNATAKGIVFHHTVDELNEDTLKNTNLSGTLQAHKVDALPVPIKGSRRTGLLTNDNLSQNSLQIEHNQQNVYDDPLTDNKIDAAVHKDHVDATTDENITKIVGNHTQKQKDKDLSKLIVNELKPGTELIGDKNSAVMSNITFTPANDTLTAMAFIAGNLLNKLWNMEKGSGEDSRETEALKHEKIADLLDLFKEPLNLRQESFLKGALEQLSEAIDKDKTLKNVSLCEKLNNGTVTDADKHNNNNEEQDLGLENVAKARKTNENENEREEPVNVETVSKINDVLSLLKKYQHVQEKLSNLKKTTVQSDENVTKAYLRTKKIKKERKKDSELTQDESASLNVFGKILEKITKLLLPPKKSKKIVKSIRNQGILKNNDEIAKTLKNVFNININESSLTSKDKIVYDYLNAVKQNPKCIFDSLKQDNTKSISRIEGDILLNLSEFFKVKSFVDLVKLLETESEPIEKPDNVRTTNHPADNMEEITTTTVSTTETITTTQHSNRLSKTKEKLKTHLKAILDDLIELQNAKGQPTNNISIADALPCIFKILNDGNDKYSKKRKNKVAAIFDSLKKELQTTATRRSGSTDTKDRPKSAIVWERVVKNFDGKNKQKTRRSMENKKPKAFDELEKQMDQIESGSKTYKNLALTYGVPPADRQVLLKTLQEDIRQYINILSEIKYSLENLNDLSTDQKHDLKEFVVNAANDINLDKEVAKNINIFKVNSKNVGIASKLPKKTPENYIQKQSMRMASVNKGNDRDVKLSRDAIINQLIKNRMQLFIRIKEAKLADPSSDMSYDIAKKVLAYLNMGNYNIARELYKVLITQPKPKPTEAPTTRYSVSPIRKPTGLPKEPLIQFDDPKSSVKWLSQDAWLKQLVNLKNMRS